MFKQVALSAPMSTLAFVRAVVLVVVSALLHQCDSFAGGNIDIAGQQLATVHITQQVFVGDSSCSGTTRIRIRCWNTPWCRLRELRTLARTVVSRARASHPPEPIQLPVGKSVSSCWQWQARLPK